MSTDIKDKDVIQLRDTVAVVTCDDHNALLGPQAMLFI
jgi:hypothetical protein